MASGSLGQPPPTATFNNMKKAWSKTHVPVLGGLVAFLGLSFGLGLIVQSFRRWRRPSELGFATAPVAVPVTV